MDSGSIDKPKVPGVPSPDRRAETRDDDDDRRRAPRHRVFKGGRILFGNLNMTMDCIIRNMSETGAKLQVDQPASIPNEFLLFHNADHLIGRVRVAWRSPKEIGVHYLETPMPPRDHPDTRLARIRFY